MLSRPQQTGYSQSRSRPSKPVRSRSATAELTRACRLACVALPAGSYEAKLACLLQERLDKYKVIGMTCVLIFLSCHLPGR